MMQGKTTRQLWLLCTAWLLCGSLHAQDLDRLKKMANNVTQATERMDALTMLIDSSMTQDLDRAATYVEQLQGEAKRAKSGYHLGVVEEKRGTISYKGSRLDSARVQYKRAYDHYWRAGSKEEAMLAYTRIGIMYSLEGRYSDAARIYGNVRAHSGKTAKVHAFLHNQWGTLYHYQNNVDSAEYYYQKSAAEYTILHDTVAQLRALYNYSVLLWNNDQRDKAKPMVYQIKDLQEKIGALDGLHYTHGRLMGMLIAEGDYEKALLYGEKQYDYAKSINDTVKIMEALSNIGRLMLTRGEPAISISYVKEALAIAKKGGFFEAQQLSLIDLGEAYTEMGQYAEAETALKSGFNLSAGKGETRYTPITAYYLGRLYHKMNRLEDAKYWLQKVLTKAEENLPLPDVVLLYDALADIYLTENNSGQAIKMAEKGYGLASASDGIDSWLIKLSNTLYQAYKAQGNYQAALQYHEQYKQLSDTLFNVEKVKTETKQLKDFEFKLEKETIAVVQQAREDQLTAKARQNALIAGFVGLLALVSLAFFVNLRRQQTRIRAQNEELTRLNATKDRIFAIIGHDMRKPALAFRGMTQKINYLLQKQDYPRLTALGNQLEESAYSLNTVTDNLLNWALLQKDIAGYQPQPVLLHQVAEELRAIFAAAARNKNITLQILSDTPAQQQVFADPLALRTILRNLIDNAIKYTPEGGTVSVTASAEGEWVNIGVQDSGIGIPAAEQKDLFVIRNDKSRPGTAGEKGTGLGLHLAYELAKLNKGRLALNTQIAAGTCFELQLPVGIG